MQYLYYVHILYLQAMRLFLRYILLFIEKLQF